MNDSNHFTGWEYRFKLFFWKKSTFSVVSVKGLVRGSTPISGHCEKSILVLQTYRDPSSK